MLLEDLTGTFNQSKQMSLSRGRLFSGFQIFRLSIQFQRKSQGRPKHIGSRFVDILHLNMVSLQQILEIYFLEVYTPELQPNSFCPPQNAILHSTSDTSGQKTNLFIHRLLSIKGMDISALSLHNPKLLRTS